MKTYPLFSVVIPTYNRAEELRRCLDSLVNQTYKDFEVLVCDDGSTDHTPQIVEMFRDLLSLHYIWEENWGGPAKPRNNGIKQAKGEWICFLDSDDWWYPEKLEICSQYLDNTDILYHDLEIYSFQKRKQKIKSRKLKKPIILDLLKNGNPLPNSSLVIRREVLEKIGFQLEDIDIVATEDFEMLLRASMITDRFCYIDRFLGAYWVGENISEDVEKNISAQKKIYEKYTYLLNDKDIIRINGKWNYRIGKYKVKKQLIDEAKRYFYMSLNSNSITMKLKSSIYLLACWLKDKSVIN